MKRKVVQQGPATLMVSLPSKWTKKAGIKKGDELELTEQGKGLFIGTSRTPPKESITIHVKDAKSLAMRMIQAPFMQGYDELTIKFDDPAAMRKIEQRVERLLGFEIVDQRESSCTIKSFTVVDENDLEKLMRRLFLLILNMAKDSHDALRKGEVKRLRPIVDAERTIERFAQFSMRLINKDSSVAPRQISFSHATVWTLEQVSDNFARFCNEVSDRNLRPSNDTVQLYGKVVRMYGDFYNYYYSRDDDRLQSMRTSFPKVRAECDRLIRTKDAPIVLHLTMIVDKITELSYIFF